MASTSVATATRKGKAKATSALAFPASFAKYKDSKAASTYIDETLSLYADVGERLHIAATVAAWHAVTHRNPALLNRLHSALRSNDQQALKLWIRRVQVTNGLILMGLIAADEGIPTADTGGPLPSDTIAEAEDTGSVLNFENKQFAIISDTVSAGEAMANLIVARWFEPDGKTDVKVFVRSNIAEVNTYGDVDALKAVLRAADPKETGRRSLNLSKGTTDLLEKIRDMVEPRIKQFGLTTTNTAH